MVWVHVRRIIILYFQLSNTSAKIRSISEQVALKLNSDCQCRINSAYITATQFACDPQENAHVVYKARLSRTPDVSIEDLILLLQDWVTSGSASVTIDHIQLNVEASCSVMINSLDDPICPLPVTTSGLPSTPAVSAEESGGINLSVYIIATLSVVVFAVILIVVVICAFFILQNRKSSKKYNLRSVSCPMANYLLHQCQHKF
jgi:hypothetical protein